ncbi:Phosphate transporter OS=Streptomyces fumanus OX=67302 GN=GCM10018772_64660 PE=3 SV=1 [Streptomyces fumanus]
MCGLGDWGTALVALFLVGSSFAIWRISRREVVDHTNVNAVGAEELRCGSPPPSPP